jgi:beta-lactamase class A
MRRSLIFLMVSIFAGFQSFAQPSNWAVVHAKTEKALQEAVAEVKGASGFIAIDLTSGEKFAVNENMVFPQGSAIKIAVLMEVYKQVKSEKLKVERRIPVTAKVQVGGSGVLRTLGDGTSELSVRDLCVLMITLSDNTATNMLIDLVGMENINATMRGLGLKETKVQRRMIDLEASKRGDENISTPAEAAKIMTILYKGEFVDKATSDAVLEILKMPKPGAFNSEIPPGVPVAFKPGGIAGVSTEWAIVYEPNRPYVIVAMENYSIGDEAGVMMKKVSRVVYDYFSRLGKSSKHGTYVR